MRFAVWPRDDLRPQGCVGIQFAGAVAIGSTYLDLLCKDSDSAALLESLKHVSNSMLLFILLFPAESRMLCMNCYRPCILPRSGEPPFACECEVNPYELLSAALILGGREARTIPRDRKIEVEKWPSI